MKGTPSKSKQWTAPLEPFSIAVGLTLAVSYRLFEPIWQVESGSLLVGLLTSSAYLAGYAFCRMSGRQGLPQAVLSTVVVSQPILLVLLALDSGVSRYLVAAELILLFAFLWLTTTRPRKAVRVLLGLVFAGLAAYPTVAGVTLTDESPSIRLNPGAEYVFSSYHDLSLTSFRVLRRGPQNGGALTQLPDGRVLLVAASGESRILDFADGIDTSTVELGLPIDVAAYRAQTRDPVPYYRITDVLYSDGGLLVAYTHWDSKYDCYTLRLIEAEFRQARVGPWATRFESQPCVPDRLTSLTGGRIAVLDPAHVLLTVGTFSIDEQENYDGWREESDYGKILKLNRETWRYDIFSRGHRNPQGLLVLSDRIWSTEHGPFGGDELNLIKPDLDYGWPLVSYGRDYEQKSLAQGDTPGDHSGFEAPTYSWLPSVGISNLINVSGGAFPLWRGDLLVASLTGLGNGRALFRLRVLEGRAVTVERIPMGRHVRDLVELPQGHLVLWDGRGRIQVVQPADHVFSQCAGCHAVRNATHGIGPDLWGVVGRPVAQHEDYEYSAAMRRFGGEWTSERLDRFLENPQEVVPGTTMEHDGVGDSLERTVIIRYLSEISGGRP